MSAAVKCTERAHSKYRAGDFEGALKLYQEALSSATLSAHRIALHSNRAACFLKLKHYSKTAEECSAVLQLDPSHVGVLLLRAQTLQALKDYQGALFDISRLLELKPGTATYLNLQAKLNELLAEKHDLEIISEADEERAEGESKPSPAPSSSSEASHNPSSSTAAPSASAPTQSETFTSSVVSSPSQPVLSSEPVDQKPRPKLLRLPTPVPLRAKYLPPVGSLISSLSAISDTSEVNEENDVSEKQTCVPSSSSAPSTATSSGSQPLPLPQISSLSLTAESNLPQPPLTSNSTRSQSSSPAQASIHLSSDPPSSSSTPLGTSEDAFLRSSDLPASLQTSFAAVDLEKSANTALFNELAARPWSEPKNNSSPAGKGVRLPTRPLMPLGSDSLPEKSSSKGAAAPPLSSSDLLTAVRREAVGSPPVPQASLLSPKGQLSSGLDKNGADAHRLQPVVVSPSAQAANLSGLSSAKVVTSPSPAAVSKRTSYSKWDTINVSDSDSEEEEDSQPKYIYKIKHISVQPTKKEPS